MKGKGYLHCLLCGQQGQSAVEYLVVVGALVAALVALPSVFDLVRGTMQQKYRSYAYGVAISDPPSSTFDEEVAEDANKVREVMAVLTDLEHFVEHPSLPDPDKPDNPATRLVEDFIHLIHDL